MTMIFVDSFSHYTTVVDKWDALTGSAITIDSTAGPRGAGSMKWNGNLGNGLAYKAYPTPLTDIIHQFRMKRTAGVADMNLLTFWDNVTSQVCLRLQGDSYLQLRLAPGHGDTVAAVSDAPTIGNSWNYIKVKIHIATSTGTFQVYLNGTLVIDFTGSTKQSTNATASQFTWGYDSSNANVVYCADFIVMNTSGAQNNDFINPMAVDALLPNAAGVYAQWTPFSGANYLNVNTSPPNTSLYVSSTTVGNQDAYGYPDVTPGSVAAIADNLYAKTTSGGTATVKSIFRSNSMDAYGANLAVPANYHFLQSISELSPATGIAWTSAELNNTMPARAQFGQYNVAIT